MVELTKNQGENFTIAISPCPNDIFIFYALIHKKIKTQINFNFSIFPINKLNDLLFLAKFDFLKISASNLFFSTKYNIMKVGASLQSKEGPRIIKKSDSLASFYDGALLSPGKNTSAEFAARILFKVNNFHHVEYYKILTKLRQDLFHYAIVVNESRACLEDNNFKVFCDLAESWYSKMNCPLPLGCLVSKSEIKSVVVDVVSDLIRESIMWARDNMEEVISFAKTYSQEKDLDIISLHIKNFVNDETFSLSKRGLGAIKEFACEIRKVL